MWTVVYVSQAEQKASELAKLLEKSKIISRVRHIKCDADDGCFEVLVPQTELDMAQDLIFETDL
ncbi:MAG: hypothetical protein LIO59_05005 [Oscillospiraceae bacterium]|nr:hypothetical protein [Oscillospiraceae bacterium]